MDSQRESKRPTMYYLPYYGSHVLWLKSKNSFFKWPVFVNRSKIQDNMYDKDAFYSRSQSKFSNMIQPEVGTTVGIFPNRTIDFLKSILEKCMENSYSKNENKTWIYTPSLDYDCVWRRTQSRTVRSFDSVVLKKGIKERIKKEVVMFQNSRRWYNHRGIPYRRGILLHGPPGCGKSSYISALAGNLKMSIAILSLNIAMMDDSKIARLIDSSPRNSLLVIEDIDVALVESKKKSEDGVITLSGLLNALDGIASAEGRILFMTTNHIEKLSSSLLRPGRVDLKSFFGYASKLQIVRLWNNFYGNPKDNEDRMDQEKYKKMIKIGKILGEKIPDSTVSCAELQGFYLLHRYSEEGILDDIDRFLGEIKKDREKQKEEEEEEEVKKKQEEKKKKKDEKD